MASAKEIRALTIDDLNRRVAELRDTLFRDQLKRKTGSLENPSERTGRRRELATVLAALAEKTSHSGQSKSVGK